VKKFTLLSQKRLVPEKIWTLPPQKKLLPSGGGREKKLFLIILSVLGHSKGVGGLTSNFLHGGGMDVFLNDPIDNQNIATCNPDWKVWKLRPGDFENLIANI
jgi:hypothetical protein